MRKATFVAALLLTVVLSSIGQAPKTAAKRKVVAEQAVDPQSILSEDVKRHLTAVFDLHDTLSEVKGYIAQARGELKTDADKEALLNIEKAMDAVEAEEQTSKLIAGSNDRVIVEMAQQAHLQSSINNPLPPDRILLVTNIAKKGNISVLIDGDVEFGLNFDDDQLAGIWVSLFSSRTLPFSEMSQLESWCRDSAKKVAKQRKWSRDDLQAKCRVAASALVEKINRLCDEEYASQTQAVHSGLEAELEKVESSLAREKENQSALVSKRADERSDAVRFFALTKTALGIAGLKDPFLDAVSPIGGWPRSD